MNTQGEIHTNSRGEIQRFARTFRLTQSAIDGLLDVAEMTDTNATAALEYAIAQAAQKVQERERRKLSLLAIHCHRNRTLPPDNFRVILDILCSDAPASQLRNTRRALMGQR